VGFAWQCNENGQETEVNSLPGRELRRFERRRDTGVGYFEI